MLKYFIDIIDSSRSKSQKGGKIPHLADFHNETTLQTLSRICDTHLQTGQTSFLASTALRVVLDSPHSSVRTLSRRSGGKKYRLSWPLGTRTPLLREELIFFFFRGGGGGLGRLGDRAFGCCPSPDASSTLSESQCREVK